MIRLAIALSAVILLAAVFAKRAEVKSQPSSSNIADHITLIGPACPPFPCADSPLRDQVRFLIGHWPGDFKIAVVVAMREPSCKSAAGQANCLLRAEPVELILGHRGPAGEGQNWIQTNWNDPYEISYSLPETSAGTRDQVFDVKRGERFVALLTPAKRPPGKESSYIATRLDRANEASVESVRRAVAESLYEALGPAAGK